jgi:tryptophanase
MTMSSKKDGLVNIGGFIGFRDRDLFREASTYNIMFEGFITYGGMAGRDMNALAQGLRESTTEDYLFYRIRQIAFLGERIASYGIPVVKPFGGHAIFVDALGFLPHIPREEFPAQTLAVELYIEAGVRTAEIGALMADRDPVTRENRYPAMEMIRLAIPRRVYSDNHMRAVADGLGNVWQRREGIRRGLRIVEEAPILRHFTVKLERVNNR